MEALHEPEADGSLEIVKAQQTQPDAECEIYRIERRRHPLKVEK
jgi:hypothetical protein